MQAEALYHAAGGSWAYAYNHETVHLRLRVKRDDADQVFVQAGDKYDWGAGQKEFAMEKIAADALFDYWFCPVIPPKRRMCYTFRLQRGEEQFWYSEAGIAGAPPPDAGACFEYPYLHESEVFRVPDWAKKAVFYQIMPDRFSLPSDYDESREEGKFLHWGDAPQLDSGFGGNLKGLREKLDYLEELGINALYLTPIFSSPSCHKYDISDYRQIDPNLGSKEELKALVDECRKRGIRVMLDAVFNHCSEALEQFTDVLEKGEHSPYKDWFHIHSFPIRGENGQPHYDTFGNFGHMPKLNTAHPEVREYLLGITRYWMEETGIDGWRLDVADEIDHEFWRHFRRLAKSINPEAYIVGECWTDAGPWLQGDQFDSAMNYPLGKRILDYFEGESLDGASFAETVARLSVRYPEQAHEVLFNLLGSHDTGRVASRVEDKRKRKHAFLFLLTYPGTPCIFYGDEYGMTGGDDPDCRKCMEWHPDRRDQELLDFFQALIRLRREIPALSLGRYRMLHAESGSPAIVYERLGEGSHALIWINHSEKPTELSLALETNDWKDAWTQKEVPAADGRMTLQLDSFSFRIIYRAWRPEGS
ncbi:alpha-glycosidase [Paenibacillus sp. YN15]|uniref:alpha-glycosidase n=1 Tax=Paenibacillus sp. YN15 TaxID=1742774 RepID=UPI000DCD88F9|nr:alpha-glycosidase [Paenibacillus sp. YN15]RAV02308.1 alpha-glycosidase [Paenibacillus sp. YN15]